MMPTPTAWCRRCGEATAWKDCEGTVHSTTVGHVCATATPDTITEPISVRIARLVGWDEVQSIGVRGGIEKWVGIRPGWVCKCGAPQEAEPRHNYGCSCWGYEPVPDFEHDWSETGPLLDKLHDIRIRCAMVMTTHDNSWAWFIDHGQRTVSGETLLLAVVRLLSGGR